MNKLEQLENEREKLSRRLYFDMSFGWAKDAAARIKEIEKEIKKIKKQK